MTFNAIFDRLPPGLQYKWVEKVHDFDRGHQRPKFKNLVEFMTRQSSRLNHPVFQVTSTQYDNPKPKPRSSPGFNVRPATFTTLTDSVEPRRASRQNTPSRDRYPHNHVPPPVAEQAVNLAVKPITRTPNFSNRDARDTRSYRQSGTDAQMCPVCKRTHPLRECPVFALRPIDERRKFVDEARRCWLCMEMHFVRDCPTPDNRCTMKDCRAKHHRLLHRDTTPRHQFTAAVGLSNAVSVCLRILPVKVVSDAGICVSTYCLLDSGSTTTIMSRDLAKRLRLHGRRRQVPISTILAKRQNTEVEVAECKVGSVDGGNSYVRLDNIHIVSQFHIGDQYRFARNHASSWEHLKYIPITDTDDIDFKQVSLLIGEDTPMAHVVLETRYGNDIAHQPYGIRTPLGWVIAGPTKHRLNPKSIEVGLTLHGDDVTDADEISNAALARAVERLWQEERHGFGSNDGKTSSIEDKVALRQMEATTQLIDGIYSVGMLWKDSAVPMPDSRAAAMRVLNRLKRKVDDNPEFFSMYKACVENNIIKGYAVKMSPIAIDHVTEKTSYLTHHGVENPSKPGKVRVVFNAALKIDGISLNSQLMSGPDLTNGMIGVLFRFRQGPIAISGDIAEMFLRVGVPEEDSDALRFLWWEGGDTSKQPSTYKMIRHIFGATDSPCACTFALQKCAKDNQDDYDAKTIATVLRNFYVDDVLKAVSSANEAIVLVKELLSLLARGGFHLTKFVSNSAEVLAALPAELVNPATREVDLLEVPAQRALGIKWCIVSDRLGVKVDIVEKPRTRRGCLSFVCSITDVLGMMAPVTLVGRQLLQEVTRREINWDDNIPFDVERRWERWQSSLHCLADMNVPRCYSGLERPANEVKDIQLHHFCDASEDGYGTVSYLRVEMISGDIYVSFMMGKSRTPPLRFISIPRLEVHAATVAVRVAGLIQRELDIKASKTIFWTDSAIALRYIKNTTRRFKVYVAHRVEEIHDGSRPEQWRHVASKDNPADLASRGVLGQKLLGSRLWFHGPWFLSLPEGQWPAQMFAGAIDDDDVEVKVIGNLTVPDSSIDDLLTRYSDWDDLVRGIAWLRKFLVYLDYKYRGSLAPNPKMTVNESDAAVMVIVRLVQRQLFREDITALTEDRSVSRSSTLRSLSPILIDGVIRVGGRLAESPLALSERHPMILAKHPVVRTLIRYFHCINAHAGHQHVLSKLRERFWIINGATTVKAVTRECVVCRRLQGRPMTQIMASLPQERTLAYNPPFNITGVDCFGPLYVKRARSQAKRYGVLFVCFSTRAVHLEPLESMTTTAFLNGLHRFLNRRGPVTQLWCDNGSNFVGGSRELRRSAEEWNQSQIHDFLRRRLIEWKFQTPTASHMCGVWERLIKSAKLALKAILGNSLVSDDVLATTLTEIECIMNSRPITPVSDDPADLEALTPNHLLMQRKVDVLPPGDFVDADMYRSSWRIVKLLGNHFWKRWLRDYLPTLQRLAKWYTPRRDAMVGDLVLMMEDLQPRGYWPLGRIVRTFPSHDGFVRSVELRTAKGHYKRPIHKLCLLEGVVPQECPDLSRRSRSQRGECERRVPKPLDSRH